MNAERWDQTNSKNGKHASATKEPTAPSVRTVLEEVFELLEDYAPLWYTEEHHERILAALRIGMNRTCPPGRDVGRIRCWIGVGIYCVEPVSSSGSIW